jgi:carbonic anhydrase
MLSPDEALSRLMEGNERFVNGQGGKYDLKKEREETAKGQHPFATIIACSDSREPPEHIFDQGIGQIFVIRSAGNVVYGDALKASVEYAIFHLNTPLVMVMGHEDCGAVKAAVAMMKGERCEGATKNLLTHIAENAKMNEENIKVKGIDEFAKLNALATVCRIREMNKQIKELEREGKLKLVAAFHRLKSGRVDVINENNVKKKEGVRA